MIIDIKLGTAYYYQGFFNIRHAYTHLIAEDEEPINIQLGANDEKIQGFINRTANNNKTPRIMAGVPYRQWVQANFMLEDTMKVEIVSPNKIILYAKGEEH